MRSVLSRPAPKKARRPPHEQIREFFVVEGPGQLFDSLLGVSEYYQEKHRNLCGKVAILENTGYVIDITPGNAPLYRMTAEFVELVQRYG